MIRLRIFISFLALALIIQGAMLVNGRREISRAEREGVSSKKKLVKNLGLTDLALWTEARYSRHPSQADLFTPFQEFPGSFEHFPAGSIIAPNLAGLTSSLRIRESSKREQ